MDLQTVLIIITKTLLRINSLDKNNKSKLYKKVKQKDATIEDKANANQAGC